MRNLWDTISKTGIESVNGILSPEQKRLVFFNQVLFFGFFATLFQIAFVWAFIGAQSLVFLIVCASLLLSLWLNSKKSFNASKWLYIISVYSLGLVTTLLLGGSALYHIQSILIFASCLILFDLKKERLQILFGLPFVIASIYIGEGGIEGLPDFSNHWWNTTARFANISSLLSISTILIVFIINLNYKNESDLNNVLTELEEKKATLEDIVEARTAKLSEQHNTLLQQNEEKEILLKEIHHRVKNNLQVIISLINLQLSKFTDESVKNALFEIQNRVRSMSLAHEKMYQTANFKDLELGKYAQEIIKNISEFYGNKNYNASIKIPENISLTLENVIPAGLILNEIVTNFFKHNNLTSEQKKQFTLSMVDTDDGVYILRFNDNGSGFPEDFDYDNSKSLGLLLISTLAEQLDGQFKFYNDNGAVYEVTIPKQNIKETVA